MRGSGCGGGDEAIQSAFDAGAAGIDRWVGGGAGADRGVAERGVRAVLGDEVWPVRKRTGEISLIGGVFCYALHF